MSETRKVHDKEFNLRGMRMSCETANISHLASEPGIRVESPDHWRAELSKEESKRFPGHGNKAMTPSEVERYRQNRMVKVGARNTVGWLMIGLKNKIVELDGLAYS